MRQALQLAAKLFGKRARMIFGQQMDMKRSVKQTRYGADTRLRMRRQNTLFRTLRDDAESVRTDDAVPCSISQAAR